MTDRSEAAKKQPEIPMENGTIGTIKTNYFGMKAKTAKKRLGYWSLVLLVLVFSSCSDDFFDPQFGNRLKPEKHYQSELDLRNSLEGVATCLREVAPNMIMLDGLRSDLMVVTENATVPMSDLYYQRYDKTNPLVDVSGYYKAIINVNEILANMDRVVGNAPEYTEYINSSVKGFLLGMRAWAYLRVLLVNGEAAIIPDNLNGITSGLAHQYLPKETLIDTLINQLLPYVFTDQTKVEYVVSGFPSAKAILGELYLEKNDYANAAKYLKMGLEVGNNAPRMYKVDNSYSREYWETIFTLGASASSETIGAVPYNAVEGSSNPLAVWFQPVKEYVVKPSSVIRDKFQSQKPKTGKGTDIYRGIGVTIDTLATKDEGYIKKYSLVDGIDGYSLDIPFLRSADLHLKLAEALNRNGQSDIALILLNQGMLSERKRPTEYQRWSYNVGVRGRVNLESRVIPEEMTDPNQIVELIEDYIIEERCMELAFEGSRMFDLIRIAKRRNNPEYLASRVAAKYPAEMQDQVKAFFMNEANWYIPVNK
jgi:hypothetical protein